VHVLEPELSVYPVLQVRQVVPLHILQLAVQLAEQVAMTVES
jgi:hypothetical protein